MAIQMNFEQARTNMIEQQIRPWDVLDQNVLNHIAEIHREDFVPEHLQRLALADVSLPLAHGQVTMTPKVEARLLQSLAIKNTDKILEIGTGCGYLTALLGKSAATVTSVDIFPEFTREAAEKLSRYHINNVLLESGDAIRGWEKDAPYDAIAITASVPSLPPCFQEQLAINGRLFAIVGKSPVMEAMLITRTGPRDWSCESLFETDLPPLIGATNSQEFTL